MRSPRSATISAAMVISAVIYCRVSKDDQRQGRSVGEQETECREAATHHEWQVAEVFPENDRSASRLATKDRPEYKRLVEHLQANKPNVLILWESSRGSREPIEWFTLLALCRTNNIKMHIVKDRRTYDLSLSRDWKNLAEDGIDSAYEVEKTHERVLRSMKANAANGLPHGKVLYGYQRVYDSKGRFVEQVIREDQAEVIREAAKRVAHGETMYVVAQDFNKRGIPTPISGPWDISKIRNLITKPAYIGKRTHKGTVTNAVWPAILEVKTWQICVDKCNDPTRKTHRDTAIKHLLSGIVLCGVCNAVVRPQMNNGIPSYLCSAGWHVSVPRTDLDAYVEQQIRERLITVQLTTDDDEQRQELLAQAEELQERLDEVEAELGNAKGRAVVALTRAMTELESSIDDIMRQARTTQTEPIVGVLISNPEKWDGLSLPEKRSFIRSGFLVDAIEVMPTGRGKRPPITERIVITWTEQRLSINPQS